MKFRKPARTERGVMEHFDPKPTACNFMGSMRDSIISAVTAWRFMNVGNRISDPVVNQVAQVIVRSQHVWRDKWGNLNITHTWKENGQPHHWLR